ncbi:MAG: hypothetical protein SCK70_00605 [bacterium]|nr:hypothetical protein [bacterium]
MNKQQNIPPSFNEIEKRIESCCDEQVAELLKEIICTEADRHYHDSKLIDALRQRIDRLIEKIFGSDKNVSES